MIKHNEREKNTQVIVTDEPYIIEYWVQKNVWGELELDDDSELLIVSIQRNLVSNYFYDLLQRGVVYGHKVTVQGDRVKGLWYLNDLSLKKMKIIMMLRAPLKPWMNTYLTIKISIPTRANRYIHWHMNIIWIR